MRATIHPSSFILLDEGDLCMASGPTQKESPLAGGTAPSLLPQPNVLVIFGGDGDLAWRKLLPAVYNLDVDGALPSHFAVVCFGLPSTNDPLGQSAPDEYIRKRAEDGIKRFSRQPLDPGHWADFSRALFFVPGTFTDSAAYQRLKFTLETLDKQFGIPGSRVYYLSVPPQWAGPCVLHLRDAGLINDAEERTAFTR